jgi:hypothetical protein
VITNLGYVRNPWINPIRVRENPRYFAPTLFDIRKVQTGRQIPEKHVRAINFIVKNRARRYVAAGEKEWLYPEKALKTTMWDKLGNRFFPMPDPRKVSFSTEILVGYKDGSAWGSMNTGGDHETTIQRSKRSASWSGRHFLRHNKHGIRNTAS